ncbi:MAG: PspC domain-containing protein [Sphingomicrobium sp.]
MQDALTAPEQIQEPRPNLVLRHDTILGVCEGIGEDFGFNPNFLRVPFAAGVLWNPLAILVIYLVLGAAFALSRWLYPKAAFASAPPAIVQPPVEAVNQTTAERLAA